MHLRRWLAFGLVAVLALTIGSPARAQIPMLAQGMVMSTVASVNVANTAAETLIYQYPIPAALIASWTSANTAYGAAPLHLRLNGLIRTGSNPGLGGSGGLTIGVNLGGATATMTLVNGVVLPADLGGATSCNSGAAMGVGACFAPFSIDVTMSPIATLTTQNCTDVRPCAYSLFMVGKFTTIATNTTTVAGFASDVSINAATLGTINVLTGQTLNVFARWASAASSNSLNVYNGVLKLGY